MVISSITHYITRRYFNGAIYRQDGSFANSGTIYFRPVNIEDIKESPRTYEVQIYRKNGTQETLFSNIDCTIECVDQNGCDKPDCG